MAPRRLAGFVAGRLCAEFALARAGQTSEGVGRGAGGEPLWPSGFAGSIAHTDHFAYAAVCQVGAIAAIGIDSEPCIVDQEAVESIRRICCTGRELAQLFDGANDALTAMTVFSCKEALYKAIHGRVGRVVDFTEIEVTALDRRNGLAKLSPTPGSPLGRLVPSTPVHFTVQQGVVHSCVCLAPLA
jgi:enterobactin synthetase component D